MTEKDKVQLRLRALLINRLMFAKAKDPAQELLRKSLLAEQVEKSKEILERNNK